MSYNKKYDCGCDDDKKYFCQKTDCRRKDWKEDDCYEEKDYNIRRKYYVVEQKYLVEEKKYDDCDKYDTKTKAVYCEEASCDNKCYEEKAPKKYYKGDKCKVEKKVSYAPKKECCIVDKKLEDELVCLWKQFTDDVDPSTENGVILIAHGLPVKITNTINGLVSKSPLVSHGLYSAECSAGKYINLYEIIIPDIPGCNGEDSTGKIFAKILSKYDIYTDGDHFHWKGHVIVKEQALPDAIHIVKIDLHPVLFTKIIIKALKKVLCVIQARTKEI